MDWRQSLLKENIEKKENEYSKSILDYVIETLNTNELSLLVDSNIEVVKRMAALPYELQIKIDLDTAKELNSMLFERKCEIYTLENKFFHGKYYFFRGKDYSCCMIGSSNLTTGGFTKNHELNTIYLIKNNSQIYSTFYVWFLSFKEQCAKIDELNECKFIDTRIDFDSITSKNLFSIYSETDAKNEIEMLTDQDLKFRLNLWLEKKPSGIYSRFNINSFKNYFAFKYKEFNFVVFESLVPANGYYYFDNKNIFQLMQEMKSLTKTEIFEMSGMTKRGYHNKNRESLKNAINKLFENKN